MSKREVEIYLDAGLPGAEIVRKGLADLENGVESVESLLLAIGRPRLLDLGFEIPLLYEYPNGDLYDLLV